jgi:hypothetical protein
MSNLYDAQPRPGMLYVVEYGYHATRPMKYSDAKSFQIDFEQKAQQDWWGNYIHPKIITWCEEEGEQG